MPPNVLIGECTVAWPCFRSRTQFDVVCAVYVRRSVDTCRRTLLRNPLSVQGPSQVKMTVVAGWGCAGRAGGQSQGHRSCTNPVQHQKTIAECAEDTTDQGKGPEIMHRGSAYQCARRRILRQTTGIRQQLSCTRGIIRRRCSLRVRAERMGQCLPQGAFSLTEKTKSKLLLMNCGLSTSTGHMFRLNCCPVVNN